MRLRQRVPREGKVAEARSKGYRRLEESGNLLKGAERSICNTGRFAAIPRRLGVVPVILWRVPYVFLHCSRGEKIFVVSHN